MGKWGCGEKERGHPSRRSGSVGCSCWTGFLPGSPVPGCGAKGGGELSSRCVRACGVRVRRRAPCNASICIRGWTAFVVGWNTRRPTIGLLERRAEPIGDTHTVPWYHRPCLCLACQCISERLPTPSFCLPSFLSHARDLPLFWPGSPSPLHATPCHPYQSGPRLSCKVTHSLPAEREEGRRTSVSKDVTSLSGWVPVVFDADILPPN